MPQLKRYLVLVFLVPQLKGGANQRQSPRYQVDQLPVFALIFVEDNLSPPSKVGLVIVQL